MAQLPPIPRFAALSTEEQVALAKCRTRRYRRIVCRCELVTEGEVLGAIARGATTLDGVKLRTRGHGALPGGLCTTRCLSLLARAAGVPMSAVTKRGAGSWLVLERPPAPETVDIHVPAGRIEEVVP